MNSTQQQNVNFFSRIEGRWVSVNEQKEEPLKETLLAALQMPNIMVLCGSGTSLGNVNGPSMSDIWDYAVNENPGTGDAVRTKTLSAGQVIKKIGFDVGRENENIEALLSQCEAWLQIHPVDEQVKLFVINAKKIILEKCGFITENNQGECLEAHRRFLQKLSRRRARDPRLKVFTTNYDLCFEWAAARNGLIVIDGFSFGRPRSFDPVYFNYDIVRRSHTLQEQGNYVEGVFQLFKLHGSVNWQYTTEGEIQEVLTPKPEDACLIYPARGKYQQSYAQPYFELVSRFFSGLREPNTCLIIAGFGFNDDHLSGPILSAIQSNPSMKLIVIDFKAEELMKTDSVRPAWQEIYKLVNKGHDIWVINANFEEFVGLIPDLKTLSPAQQLEKAIHRLQPQVSK